MWKRWLRGTSASIWRSNISAWTVSSAWLEVSDKYGGWPPPYFSITQPCRTARGQVSELGHMGIWLAKNIFSIQNFSNPHLTRPEKHRGRGDRQDLQVNRPIQVLGLYLGMTVKQKDNSSFSFCTREIDYWLLPLVYIHIPLFPTPVNLKVFIFS